MKFTVELYNPGSPEPVAVMHGCRTTGGHSEFVIEAAGGIPNGQFRDADGNLIVYSGLNVIIREE